MMKKTSYPFSARIPGALLKSKSIKEGGGILFLFITNDTMIFNIGIDFFCCLLTLVFLTSYRKDFSDTYDNRLLFRMELSVLTVLLTDIFMWLLNGRQGALLRVVAYLDNMIYFTAEIIVVICWVKYAYYRIYGQPIAKKKEQLLLLAPGFVLFLLILFTPLTRWYFYLDGRNYFHLGIFANIISFIILVYLVSASFLAFLRSRRETLIDRRQELLTIAFFAVPPFLGGIFQIMFYGLSIVWPSSVFSSLFILRNKESRAILQDALTGLNNRRNVERYVSSYKNKNDNSAYQGGVILLDINDFKHINDEFGHDVGDVALVQTAHILRAAFKGYAAFLSRYGGDEFVILLPECSRAGLEKAVESIRRSCLAFNDSGEFPFRLSMSMGCALSEEKAVVSIAELIKRADEDMYREKLLYHQRQEADE